jgi:hypothetical protein
VLKNCSRETAAQILMGGAHLYGFGAADFEKADAAVAASRPSVLEAAGAVAVSR